MRMIIMDLCDVPVMGIVYIRICLKNNSSLFLKVSQFYILAPSAMVFCRDVRNTFLNTSFPFSAFSSGKFCLREDVSA